MTGPGRLEARWYPYPKPGPGEHVVRVMAAGICGTDKHTYRGETRQYAGTAHAREIRYPLIPGHEVVAIVDDPLGQGLERDSEGALLASGDRIVVAPDVPCGRCYFCRGSFPYYYCQELQDYGNSMSCERPPHLFGGWAEQMYLLRGTKVFRVPDGLATEVAVLTEEMAVTHGLDLARCVAAMRGGDVFAESVVVLGVGPLGMCHCLKAQVLGTGTLIAVDMSSARLRAAEEILCASLTLDARKLSQAEICEAVYEATSGRGADIVVDCTGHMDGLGEAVALVRQGGVVVEAGAFVDLGATSTFQPASVCTKEVAVIGVGGERAEHYSGALRVLERTASRFGLDRLVSHSFGLARAQEAMEAAIDPSSLKVLITPGAASGQA